MKPLGIAEMISSVHSTGKLVRAWDLSPWGGPLVYMGPVEQSLPIGTVDRGSLRLQTNTGEVWALEPGDPAPTFGVGGAALTLGPFLLISGIAWFMGRRARR